MNTGDHYHLSHYIPWTRFQIYKLLLISTIPAIIYACTGGKWFTMPWVPVALLGTVTAFISGFRNTQTYNRTWEARQIYGGIINQSRSFGILVRSMVRADDPALEQDIHQRLIYRHIAWLTALRFQLREVRSWEYIKKRRYNQEYQKRYYVVPEWQSDMGEELKPFLPEEERQYILARKNKATQLLSRQSDELRGLNEAGLLTDYNFVALETHLKDLYDQQGRCERIKNFPYPRQYSSLNLFFTNLLCILIPFGMVQEFAKFGPEFVWLSIPFSTLLGWVFVALDMTGEATENPFEGSANDVPITQISRTIEIDLREMLGETDLPPAIQPVNNIVL
ncbi:bestrophin family protein [Siphonobacter aquaeclarae]|uniref:Putative membrane protein n=1 Tax=Siphonobacter aquaeclarae TaxID=563176 RepID=A0A1G9HRS3_9BACT|nr:bestrophin family ion channel [Siphonobacter aquaeclarae]SDL15263.1 putative membrane protein [Siphonobacter aquaeclarae]